MPVHSSRPQALSIAKLPMLALFTSLPWISTCEGAFGKDMAREGANETDACKPTSILIRLAISIAFYWYSFMGYHGSKLGFRTIVRECQGTGYQSTLSTYLTKVRWNGIKQEYSIARSYEAYRAKLAKRGREERATPRRLQRNTVLSKSIIHILL